MEKGRESLFRKAGAVLMTLESRTNLSMLSHAGSWDFVLLQIGLVNPLRGLLSKFPQLCLGLLAKFSAAAILSPMNVEVGLGVHSAKA